MKRFASFFIWPSSWARGGPVVAQKTEQAPKKKLAVSIKPRDVADNLHTVLASDREVYAKVAARHAGEKEITSPCELFRLSTEATASKGVEFSYVLRALRPMRQRNAPETEVEKKGLELWPRTPPRHFIRMNYLADDGILLPFIPILQ